ncbi:hypothetical protein [Agrobacterium sp. CGMCC 11546]|uniref:hypothetical protein n=1 Tax=Agrobacterium sp. CGMCC 11546 TaxID=2579248 RepID=UPI000557C776|nr:hypothetical protein [Agrobacterium sp. CGMCC 11546]QKW99407.1 hypothetical protein GSF67_20010 [Agrobacterium sp. CGMCC 11546]
MVLFAQLTEVLIDIGIEAFDISDKLGHSGFAACQGDVPEVAISKPIFFGKFAELADQFDVPANGVVSKDAPPFRRSTDLQEFRPGTVLGYCDQIPFRFRPERLEAQAFEAICKLSDKDVVCRTSSFRLLRMSFFLAHVLWFL